MAPAVYSSVFFFSSRTRVQTPKEDHPPHTLPDGCSSASALHSRLESASICTFPYGGLLGSYTAPSPCFNYALVAPEKLGVKKKTPIFFIAQQYSSADISFSLGKFRRSFQECCVSFFFFFNYCLCVWNGVCDFLEVKSSKRLQLHVQYVPSGKRR